MFYHKLLTTVGILMTKKKLNLKIPTLKHHFLLQFYFLKIYNFPQVLLVSDQSKLNKLVEKFAEHQLLSVAIKF